MFDKSIVFIYVDSDFPLMVDNFGENQTPMHRNGMTAIPKMSNVAHKNKELSIQEMVIKTSLYFLLQNINGKNFGDFMKHRIL